MTFKMVEVGVSHKRTRDFQSTEHSVSLTVDLDPEDNLEEVVRHLRESLKDQIREAFKINHMGERA